MTARVAPATTIAGEEWEAANKESRQLSLSYHVLTTYNVYTFKNGNAELSIHSFARFEDES